MKIACLLLSQLLFSTPPSSPSLLDVLGDLPPSKTNPSPPRPSVATIKRLANEPPHIPPINSTFPSLTPEIEPTPHPLPPHCLPPPPSQLPSLSPLGPNNHFPLLTHEMYCSNALLFDVHYDGVFMFAPLRYENGVVYELRVTKDKKYDYDGLCEFLKEKLEQRFYAMFFKLPECELDYYFKNFFFDKSEDEAICKLKIHENRKKDAGNMSYEELVSWAEEEAQHLKTPPKPRTSNAPDATLDVDEFDYGDTGASFESVNDQTGALSQADNGKGKMIEEDNIVNKVVDNGKVLMIEEERPVPARKAIVRNKGIVIEENDNPNVMDSDSSDSEVERDQIPDYSMTRNFKAKKAPKVSKQKPCFDKEGGEGSSRPKTLYGLGETKTILEHEEFMDDLVRKMRECDDDAELTDPFKFMETRVENYPTHDQDTH
ncbi:hypothetical protein Tco_0669231 [Tanacetum coccineum]